MHGYSASHWFRSTETYMFLWQLTLVSLNRACRNLGQDAYLLLVPQGRVLIRDRAPIFLFCETTTCSKQNFIMYHKRNNNRNCDRNSLEESCTHIDIIAEKLRQRPLFCNC